MFKKTCLFAAVLFLLLFSCAAAQTLPTVQHFSPGLTKWFEQAREAETMQLTASSSVDELFHIRDLSVFQAMLSFLKVTSTVDMTGEVPLTEICLMADNEQAIDLFYEVENSTLKLYSGSEGYLVPLEYADQGNGQIHDDKSVYSFEETVDTVLSLFDFNSPVERFDLKSLEQILLEGTLFDGLPGFRSEGISVAETYSDDGQRLTKLDLNGTFSFQGEFWGISGFVRRPGGDKPRDTAELKIVKDAGNTLTVALSSSYTTERKVKDRQGSVTGNCRITVSGLLNGYEVYYAIAFRIGNDWTADGDSLSEKVSATLEINWTDKTPGRRYMHLNSGTLKLRNVLNMITMESSPKVDWLSDAVTLELKMDGENVAVGKMNLQFMPDVEPISRDRLSAELISLDRAGADALYESLITETSKKIYGHLGEKIRQKTTQGL